MQETGDSGSTPGLGRSLGVRNGNPFQYSFLEGPMDREDSPCGVAKSPTGLIRTMIQLISHAATRMCPQLLEKATLFSSQLRQGSPRGYIECWIWILMLRFLPSCTVWNKSLWLRKGFPGSASGKEPTCQCRRHKRGDSIPGWGKSPRGGHDNPLQYSCLDNLLDRGAWRATVHWVARVGHDWGTEHARLPQFYFSFFFFQVRLAQRSWLAKGHDPSIRVGT